MLSTPRGPFWMDTSKGATTDTMPLDRWRKSSYSAMLNCVEVAITYRSVKVRDSKNRMGPILTFSRAEWEEFLRGVRDGKFDLIRMYA
jgi:Domain of unknown function (DUF397)